MKNDDIRILRDIEQYYSTQIDEMPMNGERPPGPAGAALGPFSCSRSACFGEVCREPLGRPVCFLVHIIP